MEVDLPQPGQDGNLLDVEVGGWHTWITPPCVVGARHPCRSVDLTPGSFPLQAYIANYSGHAKIDRLMFIANKCQGRPAELQALTMAATALKQVRPAFPATGPQQSWLLWVLLLLLLLTASSRCPCCCRP